MFRKAIVFIGSFFLPFTSSFPYSSRIDGLITSIKEQTAEAQNSNPSESNSQTIPELQCSDHLYSERINASHTVLQTGSFTYDDSSVSSDVSIDDLIEDLPVFEEKNAADHYYYTRLDDLQKAVYQKTLEIADSITEDIMQITIDSESYSPDYEQLDTAVYAAAADNPWITADIDAVMFGIGIQDASFTLQFSKSRYSGNQKAKAAAKADQIVRTMGSKDRFSQIVNLLTYIHNHISYDYDDVSLIGGVQSNHAHDIIGGLLYDACVCEGFSYMIKAVCDMAEIPCITVTTEYISNQNELHAVNYVLMDDGNWYLIDGTNICKGMSGDNLYNDIYKYPLKGENFASQDERYEGDRGTYSRGNQSEYIIYAPELPDSDYEYSGFYDIESYEEASLDFSWEGGLFSTRTNEDGTSCTITGYNHFASGDLLIPSEIDGLTVTEIDDLAFYLETGFTGNITIPDSVIRIGDFAFYRCENAQGTLSLSAGLTTIGRSAFMHNELLQGNILLTDNLESIGSGAFYNCRSLSGDIYINERVSFNPTDQFYNCLSIESFTIHPHHSDYASADGVVYSKDMKELLLVPAGRKKALVIPEPVEKIGLFAVRECSNLDGTPLNLPKTLTYIADYAFFGTDFSGDLYIPDSVTYIGEAAFYSSDAFKDGKLHLPENLYQIGGNTFRGCAFKGDILIPDSLEIWPGNYAENPFNYNYLDWPYTVRYSCTNIKAMQFYGNSFRDYESDWMGSEMFHKDLHGGHCTACGQSDDFTVPNVCPECGHVYNHGEVIEPALCSSPGVLLTECSNCGHRYQTVIPALGTEHQLEILHSEATCTEDGYHIERCSICGTEIIHDTYRAHGHDFSIWKTIKNPTAYTTGLKERICAYDSRHREYQIIASTSEPYESAEQLEINMPFLNIPSGMEYRLSAALSSVSAELLEISWITENDEIAAVTDQGTVKAHSNGQTKITARGTDTDGRVFEAVCDVYVYEPDITSDRIVLSQDKIDIEGIGTGSYLHGAAIINNSISGNLSFSSDDESIAAVDSDGMVWAKGYGQTDITVNSADGMYQEKCHVTVFEPVNSLKLPENIDLNEGDSIQLELLTDPDSLEGNSIIWESWNDAIVTVDNGLIKGISEGSTVVTASAEFGGKKAYCNVTVQKVTLYPEIITLDYTELAMYTGQTIKLQPHILPKNTIDRHVTWESDHPEIVSSDQEGNITAVKTGTAVITARTANNLISTCTVTVQEPVIADKIEISSSELQISTHETIQLTASLFPENTSDKSITWTSSDNTVASIDQEGLVIGLNSGTAVITAASNSNPELTASCTVHVRNPVSIYGSSLALESKVGINIYLDIDEADVKDLDIHMTMNGNETIIPAEAGTKRVISKHTYMMYEYPVTAKEMRDIVTLTVTDKENHKVKLTKGEEDYTEGYPYSASEYFARVEEVGQEKTKKLSRVLNNYGKYAQIYFDYKVTDEVKDTVSVADVTAETLESYKAVMTEETVDGLTYAGGSTMLDDAIGFRIYFKVGSGYDIKKYTFTIDNKAVTPEKSGSMYFVELADIAAKDLGVMHTIKATDGTKTFGIQYSALSYARRVLELTGEDRVPLQNMCRAMYLYNQQAIEYFNTK